MSDTCTRAQRLGLEPGSLIRSRHEEASQHEIAHSIAISLKRIADIAEFVARATTNYGKQP